MIYTTEKTVFGAPRCYVVLFHHSCSALAWAWQMPPTISIAVNKTKACANELVTYSIIPDPSVKTLVVKEWTAVRNAVLVSTQGNNATFRMTNSGFAEVKVEASANAITLNKENKEVWVGPPSPEHITFRAGYNGGFSIYTFGMNEAEAKWNGPNGVIKDYEWDVPGFKLLELLESESNNLVRFQPDYIPSSMTTTSIRVRGVNDCGCGSWSLAKTLNIDRTRPYSMGVKSISDETKTIRLYNIRTGKKVYEDSSIVNFNINETSLPKGIYVIESTNDQGERSQTKVFKK